jgi:hypothetical protein
MNDEQLRDYLAKVDAEFKARRKAIHPAARFAAMNSRGSKARKVKRTFESTFDFDLIFEAIVQLDAQQCSRFASTDEDKDELSSALWHAFGMGRLVELGKIESERASRVARASNGRRLIGASSREKVAGAAQVYRHLSREKAAMEIANDVNLSSGTVRRYLSELFPGDKWER